MVHGICAEYFTGYIISLDDALNIVKQYPDWDKLLLQLIKIYPDLDDRSCNVKLSNMNIYRIKNSSEYFLHISLLMSILHDRISKCLGLTFTIMNVFPGKCDKFPVQTPHICIFWTGHGPNRIHIPTNILQDELLNDLLISLNFTSTEPESSTSSTKCNKSSVVKHCTVSYFC